MTRAFVASAEHEASARRLAPAGWKVLDLGAFRNFGVVQKLGLEFVFPLVTPANGTFQGLLEFLGIPYAGSPMAAAVLAGDRDFLGAVVPAELAYRPDAPAAGQTAVTSFLSPRTDHDLRATALCRSLGLSGWALVTWAEADKGLALKSLDVSPSLEPEGAFLALLAQRGVSAATFVEAETAEGLARHARENGLKTHYKDTI